MASARGNFEPKFIAKRNSPDQEPISRTGLLPDFRTLIPHSPGSQPEPPIKSAQASFISVVIMDSGTSGNLDDELADSDDNPDLASEYETESEARGDLHPANRNQDTPNAKVQAPMDAKAASQSQIRPKEKKATSGKLRRPRLEHTETHKRLKEKSESYKKLNQRFKEYRDAKAKEILELTEEQDRLNIELVEQQEINKEFREERLKVFDKSKFEVEPDSRVIGAVSGIFINTESWAKDHACGAWNDTYPRLKAAISTLHKSTSTPFATERLLRAVTKRKLPAWVVLNACVNSVVCSATFKRPFAHLSEGLSAQQDKDIEDSLNWVMTSAESKSLSVSNKLRVDILQAISQDLTQTQQEAPSSGGVQPLQLRYKVHCKSTASNFLRDFALLLRDVSTQNAEARLEQLCAILEDAMRLAVVLTTQHPLVKMDFLNNLPNSQFRVNSETYKAHRGVKILDDDGADSEEIARSHGLIDRPFDLIVEPCVIRYGNQDGENYQRSKILHRGVVWMVKDKDLLPEEQPKSEKEQPKAEIFSALKAPDSKVHEKATPPCPESPENPKSPVAASNSPDSPSLCGREAAAKSSGAQSRGKGSYELRTEGKPSLKRREADQDKITSKKRPRH